MSSNRNNRVDGIGYKSSLPLTDPRHVVPHAHCAVYTDVDGQYDALVTDDRHQLNRLTSTEVDST